MDDRSRPGSEPAVARMADAIEEGVSAAVQAAARRLDMRAGSGPRFLRRLSRQPLPYLYEAHPEARRAIPHAIGVETISVDEIVGTAVGPPRARGMDFIPPRPARTPNWRERWRRVLDATNQLAVLPPIDVQRYAGRYWVLDGHNRVAAALYVGQREIDANVTELVPRDTRGPVVRAASPTMLEERTEIQAALSRRAAPSRDPVAPDDRRGRPGTSGASGADEPGADR